MWNLKNVEVIEAESRMVVTRNDEMKEIGRVGQRFKVAVTSD